MPQTIGLRPARVRRRGAARDAVGPADGRRRDRRRRASAAARRPAGHRPVGGDRRAERRPLPGRLRGRRHQGRASGGRHPAQHGLARPPRRHRPVVEDGQPQQAVRRPRPEARRRPRRAARAGRRRGRARRELPSRHAGAVGPRAGRAARAERTAGHHPRDGIRPGRPLRQPTRLRLDRRGHVRLCRHRRRARRPAPAPSHRPDRRGDGAGRCIRNDGRLALRRRPGRRRQPHGVALPADGSAHLRLPADRRAAAAPGRGHPLHACRGGRTAARTGSGWRSRRHQTRWPPG